MKSTPDWLHEEQITLPDGTSALWSYDTEGDIWEIFFDEGVASATVELAEGVYLRLDRQTMHPLSLGIVGFTLLTQNQRFGHPLLTFDGLSQLPESEQNMIIDMLQEPPLNLIVQIYSFQPETYPSAMPVGAFTRPVPLAV